MLRQPWASRRRPSSCSSLNQPSANQSKRLKKKLDQTLFIRSTKRVQLTPEGEILLRHVEPAMNLIKRGESQLIDSSSTGGQIRIGASDTICRYFLVPYLERFHKEFPNAHIKVTNQTSIKCVELLETGQVDLIVINYPNSYLSNLYSFKQNCGIQKMSLSPTVLLQNWRIKPYHYAIYWTILFWCSIEKVRQVNFYTVFSKNISWISSLRSNSAAMIFWSTLLKSDWESPLFRITVSRKIPTICLWFTLMRFFLQDNSLSFTMSMSRYRKQPWNF